MEENAKKEKLDLAEALSQLTETEQENAISYMAGMLAGRRFAEAAARKMKEEKETRDPA